MTCIRCCPLCRGEHYVWLASHSESECLRNTKTCACYKGERHYRTLPDWLTFKFIVGVVLTVGAIWWFALNVFLL